MKGLLSAAVGFAVVLAVSVLLSDYHIIVLCYIGLASIVVAGLVLLTGSTGITSFGQAAFVGLSAYASGYLSARLGLSPILGLVTGLILTFVAAYIIGIATLGLSGHYLALSTIAWGISLFFVFGNVDQLGGHTGMLGIPPIRVLSFDLESARTMFWLIAATLCGCLLATHNILRSRVGRSLRALKTDELTAESFGVDTASTKMKAFIYAALLASVSGWLYAHLARFVNPTPFALNAGVEYQFMAVIGGVTSVWGAVVGSAIVILAKEYLQAWLPLLLGTGGNFEVIVFGIIVLVLLQMNGEAGLTSFLARLPKGPRRAITAPPVPLARRTRAATSATLLEVRDVTKRFGGLTAVNKVSFDVNRGEIVALVGPNGAGKSTLFNLITGAAAIDGGTITFEGALISKEGARRIVSLGVARTFQHVHLVGHVTALENVMLGAHLRSTRGFAAAAVGLKSDQERLLEWEAVQQLNRVGLGDCRDKSASDLALGQQRILEIARALAADPDLLLLDEPAAGLRAGEKDELSRLLRSLQAEGRSILLVEHDMNFVMNLADRIVVVNFGENLASGTPREIQGDPRVIEAYLGREEV